MSKSPLHLYLANERANGAFSFILRVHPPRYDGDAEIRFYIRPETQSGDTNDYAVCENPESPGSDFIYNLHSHPHPDIEKFKSLLSKHADEVARLTAELTAYKPGWR